MSTLTYQYSQVIRFSFLHRRIRRACAHSVSKETPTTIDIKQIPSQHPISDHHRPNCICLLGTSMAAYATSPTRWLRNHIRRSPLRIGLNTKTSWLWEKIRWCACGPEIDNLLIFYGTFFIQTRFAVSARDLGILRDKMHVISGRVDISPFSLRNQGAHCVSICLVQILMQYRSRSRI